MQTNLEEWIKENEPYIPRLVNWDQADPIENNSIF